MAKSAVLKNADSCYRHIPENGTSFLGFMVDVACFA
jgi:hypothetical protein